MKYLLINLANTNSPGVISVRIKIKVDNLGAACSIGGASLYSHNKQLTLVVTGLQFIDLINEPVDQVQLLDGAKEMTVRDFGVFMKTS